MIKKFQTIVFAFIFAISASVTLANQASPIEGSCGLGENGKVAPFTFDICPEDGSYKVLFSVMPNLYTAAVDAFGLSYAEEIKESNPVPDASKPLSVAELASAEVTELSILLASIMAGLGVWTLSLSHLKTMKSGGKTEFDVDYTSTIFYLLFAAILLMPVGGFYGYQWIVAGISLLAIAFFNFFVSTLLYYYSQLIEPTDAPLWKDEEPDFLFDAERFAQFDIKSALCNVQAVHQSAGEAKHGLLTFMRDIDKLTPTFYTDMEESLVEVEGEGASRTIYYGVGVGKPEYSAFDFGEGSEKWLKDNWLSDKFITAPVECGKETFGVPQTETSTGTYDSNIYADFEEDFNNVANNLEKLPDMFEKRFNKQFPDGEGGNDEKMGFLVNYYKTAFITLRDPMVGDFRLETYAYSLNLASEVRRLACLNQYSTYRGDGTSMACKTVLSLNSNLLEEPTLRDNPVPFFANSPSEEEIPDMVIKLEDSILNMKSELRDRYEGVIRRFVASYTKSMEFVAKRTSEEDRLTRIRQRGFIYYFREFFELSYIVEDRIRFGTSFGNLLPEIPSINYNEYYLVDYFNPERTYVAKLTLPQDETSVVSGRVNERGVDVIMGVDPKIDSNPQMKLDTQLEEVVDSYMDSMQAVTEIIATGVRASVSSDQYENMDFGVDVHESLKPTYFVSKCFSGDFDNFTDEMFDSCELMRAHPFYLMKNIGTQLLISGAAFLGVKLAVDTLHDRNTKNRENQKKNDLQQRKEGDKPYSQRYNNKYSSGGIGGKYHANKAAGYASAWDKVMGFLKILAGVVGMIGLVLFLLGLGLAVILPLVPVVSAITVMIGWFILVVVSLVFGSMFVPFMVSARKKTNGGQGLVSGGFLKTYIHIIMKPLVIAISLALIWALLDLSMKLTYFTIQFIFSGVDGRVSSNIMAAVMGVCYGIFCMFLIVKVFTQVSTISGKLTETVLQLTNAGASKVSSAAGDKLVAAAAGVAALSPYQRQRGSLNQASNLAGHAGRSASGYAKEVGKAARGKLVKPDVENKGRG